MNTEKILKKIQRMIKMFCLYIYTCSKKNKPDIIRLKREMDRISKYISILETAMQEEGE